MAAQEEVKKPGLGIWALGIGIGFFVALVILIPINSFKDLIFTQVEQATNLQLNADRMGIGFPPSISFKNLNIFLEDGNKISLDLLKLSPKLISLIPGQDRAVNLWGNAFGGAFDGEVSEGNPQYVKLDMDSIQYRLMPFLPFTKEINFLGNLSTDIQFPPQNAREVSGIINLDLKGIAIKDLNISGFEIPPMNISKSIIKATATKGVIKVGSGSYFGQSTDPIEVKINNGDINLLRERLDLSIELRFSEELHRSLSILDMFLNQFKVAGQERVYRLKLVGPFTAPQPVPWEA